MFACTRPKQPMLLVCMPKCVQLFAYKYNIFDTLLVSKKTLGELSVYMSATSHNKALGHLCIASSINSNTKWDSEKYVFPFVYVNTSLSIVPSNNTPLRRSTWQGYASNQLFMYKYMAAIHCCMLYWNEAVTMLKLLLGPPGKHPTKADIDDKILTAVRYHRYALCMMETHTEDIAAYGFPVFGQEKDLYFFELVRCLHEYHRREHPIHIISDPTQKELDDTVLLILHILKCVSFIESGGTWISSTRKWFETEFFCIAVLYMFLYKEFPYLINKQHTEQEIQCLAEIDRLLPLFEERYTEKAQKLASKYKDECEVYMRELASYKNKTPVYLDLVQLNLIVSKTDTSPIQKITESTDTTKIQNLIEKNVVTTILKEEL